MKQAYCPITENIEVSTGTMRLTACEPEIAATARPGQFINALCGPCMDPLLRRPLSIFSVDRERGEFSLLYQVRGRGTVLLSEKEPGDTLDVVGPVGRPFEIDPAPDVEHILVGGGCGVVPLLFLSDVLQEEAKGRVVVLIGAQTAGAILCEREFLERDLPVELSTDDGTAGKHGFVTELLTEHLANLEAGRRPSVYACGPHDMLKQIARITSAAHQPSPITRHPSSIPCQVSLEASMACGFGVCMGCVVKTRGTYCAECGPQAGQEWDYSRVCVDGPVFYTTELVWE